MKTKRVIINTLSNGVTVSVLRKQYNMANSTIYVIKNYTSHIFLNKTPIAAANTKRCDIYLYLFQCPVSIETS